MRAELVATLVEAAVPILGGLYATLLGYGRLKPRKEGPEVEQWLARFRILGPFLIFFGVYLALSGLLRG